MYYPVPGHSHLKVLVPEQFGGAVAPRKRPSRATSQPATIQSEHLDPKELAALSPLVRVALDATFGIRDIRALQERSFAYGVRAHVRARRRTGTPAGTVKVLSAHARAGGEFHGTAVSNGRHYAWVARIEEGRLLSFRVL